MFFHKRAFQTQSKPNHQSLNKSSTQIVVSSDNWNMEFDKCDN